MISRPRLRKGDCTSLDMAARRAGEAAAAAAAEDRRPGTCSGSFIKSGLSSRLFCAMALSPCSRRCSLAIAWSLAAGSRRGAAIPRLERRAGVRWRFRWSRSGSAVGAALRFQAKLLPIVARLKLFELRRFESDAERRRRSPALGARLARRAARGRGDARLVREQRQLLTTLGPRSCARRTALETLVDAAGRPPVRARARAAARELLGGRPLAELFASIDGRRSARRASAKCTARRSPTGARSPSSCSTPRRGRSSWATSATSCACCACSSRRSRRLS